MSDPDFTALQAAARASRIGRTATAARQHTIDAWQSSRFAGWATTMVRQAGSVPATDRLRTCALIVGWAAVFYWGALAIVPPYVAPGIPHVVFLGVGLLAFATAAAAPLVLRAWNHSGLARLVRWLVA